MTRNASARLAGVAFLLYIAIGIAAVLLSGSATAGEGTAARLTAIGSHAFEMRVAIVLTLVTSFAALVLAVTLYGITKDEDHELAMLGMACRVTEGVLGGAALIPMTGLLWLGTTTAGGPADAAAQALAGYLLRAGIWSTTLSATFFAVGSAVFSWLFLRGRVVPGSLAWLGVIASVLLVAVLPLQLGGFLSGLVTRVVWLPMLVFELVLAAWLLIKGVSAPATRASPS